MDNQWFDKQTAPNPGTHMEANCIIMFCLIRSLTKMKYLEEIFIVFNIYEKALLLNNLWKH